MKKKLSFICAAACALSVVPFTANAEDGDKVYGTMNIPYADFYAAEIENAYTVDAVSSATKARDENSKAKWQSNQTGSLDSDGKWSGSGIVAGTYNDGNGNILGVTFPVEVKSSDVDKLASYDFKALDSKPTAYKEVALDGDKLTVSKLVDTNGEQTAEGSADVSTSTRYGDYQLNVKGYPENCDLYGVIVNTKEGDKYALRHLENIWRAGQISWSAGISTKEVHGNDLKFENYASSMGKTVTSVTFITLDGYTTVNVGEKYLPIKFAGEVKAENGSAGTGKTTISLTGFPDDYKKNITVSDGFTANESEISYTDAKPGKYTVTVADSDGKYAPISSDFTLTTADIPVKYDNGKLVKADNFSDDDAANYIKKLESIEINGTKYNLSGRGAVKAVTEDGTIDFDVKANNANVFDGSGNYNITLNATGYTTPYSFEIKKEDNTATSSTSTTKTTTTNASTTTTKSSSSSSSGSKTDSPKTGVNGVAVPTAFLVIAGASALVLKKKKD